ncbi:MAG TPA: hypothetical protein VFG50_16590 [Rhodothermales bacterium]|nr:hypothetical protein [Rhodothermales bacterium]
MPAGTSLRRMVALGQGVYFAATGIWPFLSIKTFEAVTGPKHDKWLVKTVGALVGVLGGVLVTSAAKKEPSSDLVQVAIGSAAALTAIDIVYVAKKRISPVYLLDAAAEIVLILGWAVSRRK